MSTDARSFVFGQVKVSNGAVATPFFLYAAGDTWQHSIQLKVPRRVLNQRCSLRGRVTGTPLSAIARRDTTAADAAQCSNASASSAATSKLSGCQGLGM